MMVQGNSYAFSVMLKNKVIHSAYLNEQSTTVIICRYTSLFSGTRLYFAFTALSFRRILQNAHIAIGELKIGTLVLKYLVPATSPAKRKSTDEVRHHNLLLSMLEGTTLFCWERLFLPMEDFYFTDTRI